MICNYTNKIWGKLPNLSNYMNIDELYDVDEIEKLYYKAALKRLTESKPEDETIELKRLSDHLIKESADIPQKHLHTTSLCQDPLKVI